MISIVTKFNRKPDDSYQGMYWCACYDGQENTTNYGWGSTIEAAIKDLEDNYPAPEEV